ncbi:MAG: element excision factor XisH family protein [Chloroflexota bacterium]
MYSLLLNRIEPGRKLYLAVTMLVYERVFSEPVGKVVVNDLPLSLLVVDSEQGKVQQWIPPPFTATS